MAAASMLDPDQISQVHKLFQETDQPIGGQFHIIGLEEIKERLGSRWPKKRDRIRESALSVMRQHLGPADICLPYGELGFVVLFARSDEETAMGICGMVKAELLRRFVGDSALAGLDVRTQVMSLADGGGREASLADIIRSMTTGPSVSEGGSANESRGDQPERRGLADLFDVDPTSLYEPVSEIDRELTSTAIIAAGLEHAEVSNAFGFPVEQIKLRFEPTYHAKSRALSIFRCLPIRRGVGGRNLEGYQILPKKSEAALAMFDRFVLAHVQHALTKAAAGGRLPPVTLPVTFDTLSRPASRQEYVAQLDLLPPDLRRQMMPVLYRLPVGIPESRLLEIVSALQSSAQLIGARIEVDQRPLTRLRTCGIACVTMRLDPNDHERETEQGLIERSAELVLKAGLTPTLRGVRTHEQLKRAITAGFSAISGPAVAEPTIALHVSRKKAVYRRGLEAESYRSG